MAICAPSGHSSSREFSYVEFSPAGGILTPDGRDISSTEYRRCGRLPESNVIEFFPARSVPVAGFWCSTAQKLRAATA